MGGWMDRDRQMNIYADEWVGAWVSGWLGESMVEWMDG